MVSFMPVRPFTFLALVCAFAFNVPLRGAVTLAPVFTDHAVLQQGIPVPVWGKASPGEAISVTFGAQTHSTKASPDGQWRINLAPLSASATPEKLVVAGRNTLVLTDIVVGEVWLCSGQSNMAFFVKWAANAKAEIAAAQHPLIRHFGVAKASSLQPRDTLDGQWQVCSPATVGDFSATAYYFAREVHQRLGIPVGIVNSSYGGTPIEAWMSETALKSDPALSVVFERISTITAEWPATLATYRADTEAWKQAEAAAKASGKPFATPKPRQPVGPGHPYMPMLVYNAMLRPLIPYALRGAIWYQGEANVARAGEYRALFSALITNWRREWAQGDFPFYFAQLANYQSDDRDPQGLAWPALREAQAQILSVPGTGMAVTIDIGDPADIHPRNKQEAGRRLALLALARTYRQKDVIDFGPRFARADINAGPAVRVFFEKSPAPLANANPAAPADILGFELAGADRVFHPAEARLDGDSVVVKSALVSRPVAVRYAWRNAPPATLRNTAGLPAPPFRSDNW
jgi:sialate O-acetylesterase